MDPSPALNEPAGLYGLLASLERRERDDSDQSADAFEGVVTARSTLDPAQRIASVVPADPPAGAAIERWLAEHRGAIIELVDSEKLAHCTVVVPGETPAEPLRQRIGSCSIRVVSAAYHLWVDRLELFDEDGNLDKGRREALLKTLGPRWSAEEERHFTEPALTPVRDGDSAATSARQAMLRTNPDLPTGTVTVVFGPGGIGKTYFLRRLGNKLMKGVRQDLTLPIPVFAELPVLLHGDALENWIANRGPKLPIDQIRTLISHGVIVPILDALDELVRGQAREGTTEFLQHLATLARRDARVLLSSRDYYLNLDPLVQVGLGESGTELKIGYFSKEGRRHYIEMRTDLGSEGAARWAGALEQQSHDVLSDLGEEDVEALIGHPLFLDAFCAMIMAFEPGIRVNAASDFKISSPDVFGDIVLSVLEREQGKYDETWKLSFEGKLTGDWAAPFSPDLQRKVLRALVLLVATDGGGEALQREREDSGYRDLRHGVFTFTSGVKEKADAASALRELLREILGEPKVASGIAEEEAEELGERAVDQLADFYEQHTLADTRPDRPETLVFATRHRAYFDYLLADGLLERLSESLTSTAPDASEKFVEWCLAHNIFEGAGVAEAEPPYSSCLRFRALAPRIDVPGT